MSAVVAALQTVGRLCPPAVHLPTARTLQTDRRTDRADARSCDGCVRQELAARVTLLSRSGCEEGPKKPRHAIATAREIQMTALATISAQKISKAGLLLVTSTSKGSLDRRVFHTARMSNSYFFKGSPLN